MNYDIKITGSGTKRDIVIALQNLAHDIKQSQIETEPKGKLTFEDSILCAEISEEQP